MNRTILGLAIFSFCVFCAAASAQKATTDPNSAPAVTTAVVGELNAVSETEIKGLIQSLENETARKELITRLNDMIAAREGLKPAETNKIVGARVLDLIFARLEKLSKEFVAGTRSIMDLPNVYDWAVRQVSDDTRRSRWLEIGWKVLLAVLVGLIGEWLVRHLLIRARTLLETRNTDSIWVKSVSLLGRTVLDVVPIIGFLAASYAVLAAIQPGEVTRNVAMTLIYANVLVRAVLAFARLVLAPAAPNLRLIPLRDADANYLFIWTRRFTDLSIYGYFSIIAIGALGLQQSGAEVLLKLLGLFLTLAIIVFVLQNKANVAAWLRGNGDANLLLRSHRRRLADVWHVLFIFYIVVLYGVWALAADEGFQFVLQGSAVTLVILVVTRLCAGGLRHAARRIFSLSKDMKQRYPGLEERANRYLPFLENSLSAIVWLLAVFAILEAWGVDAFGWLATPAGQKVTNSVILIALMLVLTIVILEVTSAIIERHLSQDGTEVGARVRTLLPLLRTALLVVLVTMFVLVTLSELGLNIAPLLAGAGVVGLAIGFGAQTLVKDIITGVFILVEDQLAVGDVVKVGTHAGVVEQLTLRTIRLRDLAGTVHVVPFSQVTTLENMTKDFSRYVFEIGVAYREDTDEVVAVLKQIGEELVQDEAYKDLIVEPLEVMGVDKFGDNSVVIKARITTKPIKQWQVGREFNRRMKKRFDELGIEIPFPHRTLYFGEDKSGDAPVARIAVVDKIRNFTSAKATAPSPGKDAHLSVVTTPGTSGSGLPDSD